MKSLAQTIGLLALCAGLLTAAPASAMPPGPPPDGPMAAAGPMRDGFDMPPPFLRSMRLTEAQQNQVFDIMHQAAPSLRAKGMEARHAQDQLHELSLSANYDEAKAKSLAEAGARAMVRIALIHSRIDNQVFHLLTPEQRKHLGVRRKPDDCGRPPRH